MDPRRKKNAKHRHHKMVNKIIFQFISPLNSKHNFRIFLLVMAKFIASQQIIGTLFSSLKQPDGITFIKTIMDIDSKAPVSLVNSTKCRIAFHKFLLRFPVEWLSKHPQTHQDILNSTTLRFVINFLTHHLVL